MNVNGSPFRAGKQHIREDVMAQRVEGDGYSGRLRQPVGGQDELVFDGGSFAVSPSADGPAVTARCASFVESLDVFDIAVPDRSPTHDRYPTISVTPAVTHIRTPMAAPIAAPLDELAEIWETLVLGARDYVRKSGFTKACIGLSGGVDSSIVAAVMRSARPGERLRRADALSLLERPLISDAEQLKHESRYRHLHRPDRTGS